MAAPMRKHGAVLRRLYVALTQALSLESRATTGVFHCQIRNASTKKKDKEKTKKAKKRIFTAPEMEYITSPLLSTHLGKVPTDNVWFMSDYPEPYFTLEEALQRHQLMAQPSIYNYSDSYVYANVALNSWTKREGFFISMYKSAMVPHPFDPPVKVRCAVLTKQKDNVVKALQSGAKYAGGTDLLAQMQTDQVSIYELDHVIATPDMMKQLKSLRPLFGDLFPNEKKGSMGEDISSMLENFLGGIIMKSQPTKTKGLANIRFPIGKINMTQAQLSENLEALKLEVHKARPSKVTGKYILQLEIEVPPSPSTFKLDPQLYDVSEPIKKQ
ncbi:large ribosomal subunit protein uL1-like [Ylistrum balloti]|uniref:large ribosomal subunit protein uL1-like n=1 Tax=Ylistrum balloti TaxID=509963 RepID=UPI002905CD9A|nr:large ribosomal subunit protein uL1-like [Ylistrum balloti]